MKILVLAKRVVDANVQVRVRPDGSGVEIANTKMSMNPFDEIAVEEAVRLKERGVATEVLAVTCGNQKAQDTLRVALALGADRGILIECEGDLQPLAIAKILTRLIERESPDIVILGKQSIDDDANEVGQMLSALTNLPQATFASVIDVVSGGVRVTREIDGGSEIVELSLPAVVTADLRLNEPRYVKLPDVMKAKKKPLEILPVSELGVDASPRITIVKYEEPRARAPGVLVSDVAELVRKLRCEACIL